MKAVNIGLIGLGTVGCGTLTVLRRNVKEISRRAGCEIRVTKVAVRDLTKTRDCDTESVSITDDPFEIVNDSSIDIVVELIGGETLAHDLVLKAIENGKHVVTANKALIALKGNELFAKAQEEGVMIAFEAGVAGGIPIIKALREGLAGNRIESLAGIINGTGNYILTEMEKEGANFPRVLAEAQRLGYAESDPTFDVEGIDAAHKLTILASIAFGIPLQFDRVYTQGISTVTQQDVNYARELGYRIKHLGIAKRRENGIELRVHPTLVASSELIANVNGVMNAVVVKGDAVGTTLYYGPGAGAEPTASAVIADIIDVVRVMAADEAHRVPHLAFQPSELANDPVLEIEDVNSAYYLRLSVRDEVGVMANVTRAFADQSINIESLLQKHSEEGCATVIVLTKKTQEKNFNEAVSQISGSSTLCSDAVWFRVEGF